MMTLISIQSFALILHTVSSFLISSLINKKVTEVPQFCSHTWDVREIGWLDKICLMRHCHPYFLAPELKTGSRFVSCKKQESRSGKKIIGCVLKHYNLTWIIISRQAPCLILQLVSRRGSLSFGFTLRELWCRPFFNTVCGLGKLKYLDTTLTQHWFLAKTQCCGNRLFLAEEKRRIDWAKDSFKGCVFHS